MFTGIIEEVAQVVTLERAQENLNITLRSTITPELKIDQSVSHNGVCLTVVKIESDLYTVTAIKETLEKTNILAIEISDEVNIERSMLLNGRIDGHMVQGHVDQTAICVDIQSDEGSWKYKFTYDSTKGNSTVRKGSITVNGVSLTVVDSEKGVFSVAIIPYTKEHTNFKTLKVGEKVNLEFDIIGKYVANYLSNINL